MPDLHDVRHGSDILHLLALNVLVRPGWLHFVALDALGALTCPDLLDWVDDASPNASLFDLPASLKLHCAARIESSCTVSSF